MKKISRLVLCLCVFCLTGCVNYADMLETQTQAIPSEEENETKIVIGDTSMVVKSSVQYCRFVKEDGDVKMTGML